MTDSAEIPASSPTDPTNAEIAAALDELGDLYELDGAVVHRVVAYRNAAKAVREAPVSVTALAREGRATELPGIGATLAGEDHRARRDRRDPRRGEAAREVPAGADRDDAPAGPRAQARAAAVRRARASTRSTRCATAAEEQRIRDAQGLRRRRSRRTILAALDGRPAPASAAPRFVLDRALAIAEPIVGGAARAPGVRPGRARRLGAADGRHRQGPRRDRHRRTTRSRWPQAARRARRWSSRAGTPGEAGARVRDAHRASRSTCGSSSPTSSATCSSTSPAPRQHNVALREAAVRRACTSPSTGCSTTRPARRTAARPRRRSTRCSACRTSSPSCARTAASSRPRPTATLPELIELGDLRGDLHCHTTASTAQPRSRRWRWPRATRGYEYLAITDHSASTASATTSRPTRCARRSSEIASSTRGSTGSSCSPAPRSTSSPTARSTTTTSCSAELDWVIA